jgi:bifunctional UDP-N-acetylglucosamine pyrophosphorylase/glucosamine-1-phosphate N-acetyltransferase
MKSPVPKVLHRVAGRTLLDHVIDAVQSAGCQRIIVVVGAHSPQVAEHVQKRLGPGSTALQDPPLGTGHAVLAAAGQLEGFEGDVVVTYADGPLQTAETIDALFQLRQHGADLGVLGFEAADPGPYGRLMLGADNDLHDIIEARDAGPDELAVTHCNSGLMVARWPILHHLLGRVRNDNSKGEYYLTDVVRLANQDELKVRVAMVAEDTVQGVNSQKELAAAEAIFQERLRDRFLTDGVTMAAPQTVMFNYDTRIEAGVTIEPNVVFGAGVSIESGAVIRAFSHLEGASVARGAIIGPYARLRPGAEIGADAHIGNFVEVKKVKIGPGAKANHLAYLGDGTVGAKANIGAGTIFCNYDGFDKFETHVGAGAFVGSNSSLVAPVSIGEGAMTGSGSVITSDVEADALGLGRGRQEVKPGWAAAFRLRKKAARGTAS